MTAGHVTMGEGGGKVGGGLMRNVWINPLLLRSSFCGFLAVTFQLLFVALLWWEGVGWLEGAGGLEGAEGRCKCSPALDPKYAPWAASGLPG